MNFRLLIQLIKWNFFSKKLVDRLEPTRMKFRVGIFDIDYNFHLNNAKYLSFMDLGRLNMTVKLGMFRMIFKKGWQVVATGVNIMYRHPIAPFAKFSLETKILYWDEKWFYIEQDFISKGRVCARAIVRAGFTKNGLINPQEVLDAAGFEEKRPQMPKYLQELIDGERHFVQATLKQSQS